MTAVWTSGYVKAQVHPLYQNQTNVFHVVKPRTLQQVNNELEFTYTIDKSAMHFQIKLLTVLSSYRIRTNRTTI
ncbi:hypothetical protein CXF81_18865 [Glaciecola sp. 33A]|nr:hypothetical protein CXF81_18865 [Glaciecola sp. 33A]